MTFSGVGSTGRTGSEAAVAGVSVAGSSAGVVFLPYPQSEKARADETPPRTIGAATFRPLNGELAVKPPPVLRREVPNCRPSRNLCDKALGGLCNECVSIRCAAFVRASKGVSHWPSALDLPPHPCRGQGARNSPAWKHCGGLGWMRCNTRLLVVWSGDFFGWARYRVIVGLAARALAPVFLLQGPRLHGSSRPGLRGKSLAQAALERNRTEGNVQRMR